MGIEHSTGRLQRWFRTVKIGVDTWTHFPKSTQRALASVKSHAIYGFCMIIERKYRMIHGNNGPSPQGMLGMRGRMCAWT